MGMMMLFWEDWAVPNQTPLQPPRLTEIEARLEAAGVEFLRDFCWQRGEWLFIVGGELVATGGAIGTLEWDMQRWWRLRSTTGY
jgi:hypothetical protein